MADLTPERASLVREELKRLMRKEARNTRKLRELLDELTELADEREDLDHAVGDIVWSELSDDNDPEMVSLALEGLDMDQLLTIIGRSSRPRGQLQSITARFRVIAAIRRKGKEEGSDERNRDHIILSTRGGGGRGGSHAGECVSISWPGGGAGG